ncbi:MAG: hypothetical protein LKE86_08320 [Eubacterium sp.]|jgi:hypothetical protein|nr:hypothetical protein [Eubacterium sp.]MCH4047411.1 hypothetical protein [Eubacterium sp.]MCH4080508.1 hypothetical protein [Eubacterium sp.]
MNSIEQLRKQYGEDKPIFLSDFEHTSTMRAFFSRNVAAGRIERFSPGIYYFARRTEFGKSVMPLRNIYEEKYIRRNGITFGYYSGLSFQHDIGYTEQVPNIPEITTNTEATARRILSLDGRRKLIVKKPRVKVTDENAAILPLMDLVTVESSNEMKNKYPLLYRYIQTQNLTRSELLKIIPFYPAKTAQKLIETELVYVFE